MIRPIAKKAIQPMTRGQITIPAKIRKKLNIDEETWLWIKLFKNKIIIEPIEKEEDIEEFLAVAEGDENAYWHKDEGTDYLDKMDDVSKKNLKNLNK